MASSRVTSFRHQAGPIGSSSFVGKRADAVRFLEEFKKCFELCLAKITIFCRIRQVDCGSNLGQSPCKTGLMLRLLRLLSALSIQYHARRKILRSKPTGFHWIRDSTNARALSRDAPALRSALT